MTTNASDSASALIQPPQPRDYNAKKHQDLWFLARSCGATNMSRAPKAALVAWLQNWDRVNAAANIAANAALAQAQLSAAQARAPAIPSALADGDDEGNKNYEDNENNDDNTNALDNDNNMNAVDNENKFIEFDELEEGAAVEAEAEAEADEVLEAEKGKDGHDNWTYLINWGMLGTGD